MPGHHRSKSKSHSVFSIDTLRVFSRAGSRQACRGHTDQKENARPPSPPSESYCSQVKPQSTSQSSVNDRKSYPSFQNGRITSDFANPFQNRKSRFSWFSTSGHTYLLDNSTVAFANSDETLDMGQPIISGPVLTSTTNTEVANAAGIRCDVLPSVVANSRTDVYLGVPRHGHSASNGIEVQPRAFARFGALVKSKLRPWHRTHITSSDASEHKSDGSSFLEQQVQRCHAETLNLRNSKARNLTGNGNVKRKNLRTHKENAANSICKRSVQSSEESLLEHPQSRRFVDFASGDWDKEQPSRSLSRSFHSALEKLDKIGSSPPVKVESLRPVASRTHLNQILGDKPKTNAPKINQEPEKVCEPSDRGRHAAIVDSSGLLQDYVTDFSNTSTESRVGQLSNTTALPQGGTNVLLAPRPILGHTKVSATTKKLAINGIERSEPMQVTLTEEGYIPTKPYSGYPGGINPLRMHTNTMTLYTAPAERSPNQKSYKEIFEYWRDLPVDAHGRPLQPQPLDGLQEALAIKTPEPYVLRPSTLTTLARPRRNTEPHHIEQGKYKQILAQDGSKPSPRWLKSEQAMMPVVEQR